MGSAKFTFGAIALLLGLGLFVAVGWHFFYEAIPGVKTMAAIGTCGIGIWLCSAGVGQLREAFAGEPPTASEMVAAREQLDAANAEHAIDELAERDVALLAQLSKLGVDLDRERAIDLHFFAPDVERARDLAARLQADFGGQAKVGVAGDDGEVRVEMTVTRAPRAVASREQIELRVRTATRFGARHDGWAAGLQAGEGAPAP